MEKTRISPPMKKMQVWARSVRITSWMLQDAEKMGAEDYQEDASPQPNLLSGHDQWRQMWHNPKPL